MKKSIKALFIVLVLSVLFIPFNSKAAVVPSAPTGLGVSQQLGDKFELYWTGDSNLLVSGDYGNGDYTYFGYEVTVKGLNNKTYTTVDKNVIDNGYDSNFTIAKDFSKVYVILSNKNLKTNGFRFSVRSYVYDENGNKVYSPSSSEKVIIPRATVTGGKIVSTGKAKISWKKIKGAKSYTIYLSTNGGKSYKKKGTTKKNSIKLSKLNKYYYNYYVYVVANNVKYKKKKYSSTKPLVKDTNYYKFYIYKTYK